jgi:hypothetical protein
VSKTEVMISSRKLSRFFTIERVLSSLRS